MTKDGLTALETLVLLNKHINDYLENEDYCGGIPDSERMAGRPITLMDLLYDDKLAEWYGFTSLETVLAKGSWYAKGYRLPLTPETLEEQVPAGHWRALKINPSEDTAFSSNGVVYVGLRFHENRPRSKRTISAESECRQNLVERMKAPRDIGKEALFDECVGNVGDGLSKKAFDRSYKKAKEANTTHETWERRGPIPKI